MAVVEDVVAPSISGQGAAPRRSQFSSMSLSASVSEEVKEEWRANHFFEHMESIWLELRNMQRAAKSAASAPEPAVPEADSSESLETGPRRRKGRSRDEWDPLLDELSGDGVGEETEQHFIACLRPLPIDTKLLRLLGEEGERLLGDDYDRMSEYFRNKHMKLDRQELNSRFEKAKFMAACGQAVSPTSPASPTSPVSPASPASPANAAVAKAKAEANSKDTSQRTKKRGQGRPSVAVSGESPVSGGRPVGDGRKLSLLADLSATSSSAAAAAASSRRNSLRTVPQAMRLTRLSRLHEAADAASK